MLVLGLRRNRDVMARLPVQPFDNVREYPTYPNRPVLVTGGLGFIGSNPLVKLAGLGARVTVVDSLIRPL
jgi:hypothetical protein